MQSDNADPLAGDPIWQNDKVVGYVTSGTTGFRCEQVLALGYVEYATSIDDNGLEIEILGRRCKVRYLSQAAYDPDHTRCRS